MKSVAPDRRRTARTDDYGTYGADFRFTPVEDITDAGLRRLYAYWNEARGNRPMPGRDAMTPRALAPWLRHIQTFEVVHGGNEFRSGVCGSGISEMTGLQMTGQHVSEFPNPRLRERIRASLRRVVETREPVHMVGERAAHPHLPHKRVETIWLPFGGDSGPTHILAGVLFVNRAA